jgi:DNA-binding FadR family transcriptional regulator
MRTPVREAFVRLQQEGLLEIVPRHGVRDASSSAAIALSRIWAPGGYRLSRIRCFSRA